MPPLFTPDLLKVLLITLAMHTASTSMRFTLTLDAIAAGATSFEIGVMLAFISLGPMLFAVPSGKWLDRAGPRQPIAAARIGMIIAGTCAIALPAERFGMASLCAAATLTGFSFMLTNIVVQRLTGDVSTIRGRQFAFTALSLTTATSNLTAPVIAGYVIEHTSHSAVYCWAILSPLLLSAALLIPSFAAVLRSEPRGRRAEAAGTKGSPLDFLRDRPMQAVLLCSVIISIAWEVGNLLIPIYADSAGLTPSEIGWVLGSFAAATFIVRFLTPILLRYVLEWHMIVLSLFLAASAFALMPLSANPLALMGAAFILGLGLGASLPNMMSLVYLFAPPERIGEAIGLRIMALNLGKSIFPVLAGFLGNLIGAGSTIWALSLFTAGGFGYAALAAPGVLARMRALKPKRTEHHDRIRRGAPQPNQEAKS